MSVLTNLNEKIRDVNFKINRFESKIAKREDFCCLSCPSLIREIESDLKKLIVDGEKNLSKKQVAVFKKSLKSTQKRWTALSSKVIKNVTPRCAQNVLSHPIRILKQMGKCLPNLAVIGAGVCYSPSFAMGCLTVIPDMALGITLRPLIAKVVEMLEIPTTVNPRKKFQYTKLLTDPIRAGLVRPIAEEVLFRGILQKAVGLIPSSVLFGLGHAFNPHKGAINQAVLSTFSGLLYGYLAENYGIEAPIGAHILNNSLCCLIILLLDLFSLEE